MHLTFLAAKCKEEELQLTVGVLPGDWIDLETETTIFELLRLIEEATSISDNIKRGETHMLDFVFDVMLPELLIKVLQERGITRLRAEQIMTCGSIF